MTPLLIIDPEFRDLIPPLSKSELEHLEESLLQEGCREPIMTWNQIIIDGHHRYEICSRHDMPFKTIAMAFPEREDAVSWICLNQLSRRNLSEEAYRYLVGKRYDAEKIMNQRKNEAGSNQYTVSSASDMEMKATPQEKRRSKDQHRTSIRLGAEYHINHSTVESYGRFSRALDAVEQKAPGIRQDVLSGAIRISKAKIDQMASMPDADVQAVSEKLHTHMRQTKHVTLQDSTQIIDRVIKQQNASPEELIIVPGIKEMPAFDPDAEINGLLLTAPTWITTIQRLTDRTNFHQVSEQARRRLNSILRELESVTSKLQHKAGIRENGY